MKKRYFFFVVICCGISALTASLFFRERFRKEKNTKTVLVESVLVVDSDPMGLVHAKYPYISSDKKYRIIGVTEKEEETLGSSSPAYVHVQVEDICDVEVIKKAVKDSYFEGNIHYIIANDVISIALRKAYDIRFGPQEEQFNFFKDKIKVRKKFYELNKSYYHVDILQQNGSCTLNIQQVTMYKKDNHLYEVRKDVSTEDNIYKKLHAKAILYVNESKYPDGGLWLYFCKEENGEVTLDYFGFCSLFENAAGAAAMFGKRTEQTHGDDRKKTRIFFHQTNYGKVAEDDFVRVIDLKQSREIIQNDNLDIAISFFRKENQNVYSMDIAEQNLPDDNQLICELRHDDGVDIDKVIKNLVDKAYPIENQLIKTTRNTSETLVDGEPNISFIICFPSIVANFFSQKEEAKDDKTEDDDEVKGEQEQTNNWKSHIIKRSFKIKGTIIPLFALLCCILLHSDFDKYVNR